MSTRGRVQWLIEFEYVPFGGQQKVESEQVYGTEAAARTYFNSFKNDPRFRSVSLIREVTDRQIMASYGAAVLTPDPED